MKKSEYVFDHEKWFYRQMFKAPSNIEDNEVIELMRNRPALEDQLRVTPRFQILVSDDGFYKEVWSMIERKKDDG